MTTRLASWGKRQNKYNARRIRTAAGVSFDSQSEMRRYRELELLELAGEIRTLTLHPRFKLEVNGILVATYVGDFAYEAKSTNDHATEWLPIVEDRKAGIVTQTDVFRLKRKLMKACLGIDILVTGKAT